MKNVILLAAILSTSVGCHSQIQPNPTVLTCPAATGSTYAALNQSSPAAALTYTDSPAAGNWCYIAQSVLGSNSSVPSNISGPFTTNGTQKVDLTWQAPSSGPIPSGYVLSRVAAIQSTLGAPALGTNPTIADNFKPVSPEMAKLAPFNLTGKIVR